MIALVFERAYARFPGHVNPEPDRAAAGATGAMIPSVRCGAGLGGETRGFTGRRITADLAKIRPNPGAKGWTYVDSREEPFEESLAKPPVFLGFSGAPGRIQTCGLRLRRPTLYPTELRARTGADPLV